MSLLDELKSEKSWEDFYAYKLSLACPKAFTAYLRAFIDSKAYLPVCALIDSRARFPLPKKTVLSKLGTAKKRVVYTYPRAENTVLKLLTHLLLRKYDGLFSEGLYSFRPGRCAKDAVRALCAETLAGMCSYKADISDYFNSVPIDKLLPELREATADDARLYDFLSSLLSEPRALWNCETVTERKGIMAGTPLSAFYANLYLRSLDRHFTQSGIPYARYSDDMIVFAPSSEETARHAEYIRSYLSERGLEINPDKESFATPEEGWTFLGFSRRGGETDIAPATVKKLKGKMRRKARALARWSARAGADGERAAKAFIRIFNRKLFEGTGDSELTWSRWFFPVITTTRSLREIDRCAQECLRFIISGTHRKSRYNVRYQTLKSLGYRTLVNEYYSFEEGKETENGAQKS